MSRLFSILFFLYILVLFYVGYMNHQRIELVLYPGKSKDISLWMFMLLSSLLGALFVFILYVVRDTRRFIFSIKEQKKQKQKERIQQQFSRALSAINQGKTDEAKRFLLSILEDAPEHKEAIIRLAEIYELEGNPDEAESLLSKVFQKDPEDSEVALFLARILLQKGRHQDAMSAIEPVMEKQPMNIRGLFMKREILEKNKRWKELVQLQKQILTVINSPEEKLKLLGYMHELGMEVFKEGDTEKAKEIFQDVLKEEGDRVFVPTHLAMAEVLYSQGKVPEAIDYLEGVFKRTGSLLLLARLEEILLERSSPSRLIEIYRDALERWPENEILKFFMAKLYFRLEMLDDAMAILSEIDEERIPHTRKIKGMIYLRRGQTEDAATEFRKALDMKNTLKVPYRCSVCGTRQKDYHGRCENCGTWNSYCFEIEEEVCMF